MPEAVSEAAESPGSELHIHSFIVRMWLKEVGESTIHKIWRGRITHIPGDEQQYFTDVNEISVFIEAHLKEAG